jgi:membrane protease YdiL (CAAX protease family)
VFDLVLTVCLVLVVPTYGLWRSLRPPGVPKRPVRERYFGTIAMALALTVGLAAVWLPAHRSAADLGLGLPLAGKLGLGLAAIVLAMACVMVLRAKRKGVQTPPETLDLLPKTPGDFAAFLAMGVVVGLAWEVLFRGYLLWFLTPRLGIVGAVLAASAAYGAAHGYKSPKQFIGSLVAALVFTTAYALTHSLWWLMLIHAGLPVLVGLANAGGPSGDDEAVAATPLA